MANLRDHGLRPLDSKYEVAAVQNGGFLRIHQIDSAQDSGIYTCIVRNRGGEEGRREIELNVNSEYRVARRH